jgi:hypothetical protein
MVACDPTGHIIANSDFYIKKKISIYTKPTKNYFKKEGDKKSNRGDKFNQST